MIAPPWKPLEICGRFEHTIGKSLNTQANQGRPPAPIAATGLGNMYDILYFPCTRVDRTVVVQHRSSSAAVRLARPGRGAGGFSSAVSEVAVERHSAGRAHPPDIRTQ